MYLGLTAAVHAAARAAHDLDKVIIRFAGTDFVHDHLRIAKPRRHSHFHVHPRHIVCCFFDPVRAAHFREFYFFQFFSCQFFHCSPERSLHDASCRAEDHTGSRGLSQRVVEALIRKTAEVDPHPADQPCQFSCGDGDIHVRHPCRILVIPLEFKLFRGTGHDADTDDILRRDPHLLRVISLCDGAEHLLWRFAAR